jgi:hypothetical protein
MNDLLYCPVITDNMSDAQVAVLAASCSICLEKNDNREIKFERLDI